MDKNSGSRSNQSYQSGGGSQPKGGNYGSGRQSGNSYESPRQVVRELSQGMARSAGATYYHGQQTYQKFMDGDYQ